MAPAIPYIIMAAGSAMSAYSSLQGGKAAAEAGKAQQAAFEGEAQGQVDAGAEASRAKRAEGRELLASQIAAVSAGGGGLVGSNLVVMAESARKVEMDALTIERNSQTRAKSLRTRGAFAKYEGQLARRNARIRALTGGLKAAGSLYLMYQSNKPKDDKSKYETEKTQKGKLVGGAGSTIGGGTTAKTNAWSAARAGG